MIGLQIAFKEWAVICRALAEGHQSLILRKGGIAEEQGEFRAEHPRFWLYPTYVHQQETGIIPAARDLLRQVEADRPAPGHVRLTHIAAVRDISYYEDLDKVLSLAGQHIWSEETVRARFAYRRPGLFALTVAVEPASEPREIIETPEYAGCKSWVVLREKDDGRIA